MEFILLIVVLVVVFFVIKNKQTPKKYNNRTYQENALKTVKQNTFTKKRVLNKEEVNIYYKLIKIISSLNAGYKLSTQVSLGEILSHSDYSVYRTINTQRADFVIMDKDFYPVLVIEYNGVGHFKGDYKSRDARKKEALNSAGIEVVVITNDKFNDDTGEQLKKITKLLKN
jgi:hypothetical protein